MLVSLLCVSLFAASALAEEEVQPCEPWKQVKQRELVKMCSLLDDEKTFCNTGARKMRLGGKKYFVPCVYDVETHHCRERFMCNVPEKMENDQWDDIPETKRGSFIVDGGSVHLPRRRVEDLPSSWAADDGRDCAKAEELQSNRDAAANCMMLENMDVCQSRYMWRTMAGGLYAVPCREDDEVCMEDLNCAVMTANITMAPTRANVTMVPTYVPTFGGNTTAPTSSPVDLADPTQTPTLTPSSSPSFAPSRSPTLAPSASPSYSPTYSPTLTPSASPSCSPTYAPTLSPSMQPSFAPSKGPTLAPSEAPSLSPTSLPTRRPSKSPTASPTPSPTESPTPSPTIAKGTPSMRPTRLPTRPPTKACSRYAWTEGPENLSGYTNKKGEWKKDGTCCHPDCPKCTSDLKTCSGQRSPVTFQILPDEACCRNVIIASKDNTCDAQKTAPCFFEQPKSDCNNYTSKKKCKGKSGCDWLGGICITDANNIPDFQKECPCKELASCTPTSLETAAVLTLGDNYAAYDKARQEFEEEYGDEDNRKVTNVANFQTQLINDGVILPLQLLAWYQLAGCDSNLWTDVTSPPVHVCLTDSMVSFHVVFETRNEGYWVGDKDNELDYSKVDNSLSCFQSMARKYKDDGLKLVTFAVDQSNRGGSKRCGAYSNTDLGQNKKKDFNERSVAFRVEKEWGCPRFKKQKSCGKIDLEGYLMNLRVDDVGMTDDRCMCQLMCEDRDQGKYIAWTWNVYEGKCTCVYSARKDLSTGKYVADYRWNNLSGMMNGAEFVMTDEE